MRVFRLKTRARKHEPEREPAVQGDASLAGSAFEGIQWDPKILEISKTVC
jgi:hypothetical protein